LAGIKITGLFDTGGGEYPLVRDIHLLGGFRVVDTLTDRDNITTLRRKWGMLCYVLEDNTTYQLLDQGNGDLSNNTNWVTYSGGGGGSKRWIEPVRVISDNNFDLGTISNSCTGQGNFPSPVAIDNVTLNDGDRVALFNQDDPTTDGIWVYDASNEQFCRAKDFQAGDEVDGVTFIVEEGSYADTQWLITNDKGNATVGTHDLVAVRIGGTGNNVKGYTAEFTQSDLSGGFLNINHNLYAKYKVCNVTIMDNEGDEIEPDNILFLDQNNLRVDLRSIEPIIGTWSIVVVTVSNKTNDTTKQQTPLRFNEGTFNSATFNGIIS